MVKDTAYLEGQEVRRATCGKDQAYGKTTSEALRKLLSFLSLKEWAKRT